MNWLDNIGQAQDEYFGIETLEDNSEKEWRLERLGKVTGSQLGKLVKKDRSGGYKLSDGKVATDLLYKIAWERFLITESEGLNRLNVSSQAMQHGNDYELSAIKSYEELTGTKVTLGNYKFINKDGFFGGTPDGFVEDDLIIEVKCPWNGGLHLKSLITKEIYNPEHFYQIQGYLLLTSAKACDYITYDPDLPEGINTSIIRVERDQEVIGAIENIIEECKKIVEDLISKVSKRAR